MPATKSPPVYMRDLMTTDPVTVDGATTASELAIILDENEISGVPVLDANDHVVGVVSRTDLLHRCVEGPLGSRPGSFLSSLGEGLGGLIDTETLGVVSEFMNPEPVTASADDKIVDVAQKMRQERVHRVIVIDDQRHLRGIATSLDMLSAIRA